MGRRGPSRFRRLDVERAIRSARGAGLSPSMIEIELKDGSIIRIHADNLEAATDTDVAATKAWQREIQRLRKEKQGGNQ